MSLNSDGSSREKGDRGGSRYTYSLRRTNGFDTWQKHVRELIGSGESVSRSQRDRDLRRVVIPG
ncbi:MAG TPA: hypothetical protein VGM84_10150 [Steroidobacteraceae bacterium]